MLTRILSANADPCPGDAPKLLARAPPWQLNSLHGRSSFVKMHHFIGGPSRYWVLEPKFLGQLGLKQRYDSRRARVRAPIAQVLVALHHAGVAKCQRVHLATRSGGSGGEAGLSSDRCDMNESVYSS